MTIIRSHFDDLEKPIKHGSLNLMLMARNIKPVLRSKTFCVRNASRNSWQLRIKNLKRSIEYELFELVSVAGTIEAMLEVEEACLQEHLLGLLVALLLSQQVIHEATFRPRDLCQSA